MKPRVIFFLSCAIMLFILSGCRLAREDAGTEFGEDRLAGVLMTDGDLTEEYQGRLYATKQTKTITNAKTGEKIETEEYVFEDIDGVLCVTYEVPATAEEDSYINQQSSEGLSDVSVHISTGDELDNRHIEGTIYVTAPTANNALQFNPVYQSADGRIYAVSGSGLSAGGIVSEGTAFSQTLEESYTISENGLTKMGSITVTITAKVMSVVEKIVVLQMDKNNALLKESVFAGGVLPEEFETEAGAAYIIVVTHKKGETKTVARTIIDSESDGIDSFMPNKNGIFIKHTTKVNWK